jgi:hypothetical protein
VLPCFSGEKLKSNRAPTGGRKRVTLDAQVEAEAVSRSPLISVQWRISPFESSGVPMITAYLGLLARHYVKAVHC